jgi:large subunit ribosomal protein L10
MGKITEKKEFVKKLRENFQKSKGVYLVEKIGVDANTMNALRKRCRESGSRFLTTKNRLAQKALGEMNIASLDKELKGPTSLILSFEDPSVTAKILSDFANDNKEKVKIKGCVIDGTYFAAKDVERLATLPSKAVLLSQLCSVLNAPMRNLAGALSGIIRNVAYAIDAVAKQKASTSQS